MLVMSPERPPSSDGGPALESPNMVLSSIPIESGHVLQQQHHQQIPQQQQYHQSISHAITNGNYTYATSPSSTTSSKLLVLQPNQLNDSYITTNDSNAVGNIVLLATEQMEIGSVEHNGVHSSNTTDEELTSLTWLHDKNLLKVNNLGINLTCTNGNAIKTIDENSPPRRKNSGAISPTSDFLDDSCVSEDNASSANSLSDQGISIYSTETTIPTSYQFVNNNNSINKNRNQMPTSTTQVIQLGPAGTVIEYMTTNLQGKINTALQQTSNTSTVITSTSTTVTSTPTHQHFHKKYLREEHNKTLKEMTEANSSSSPLKLEHNSSSNYDTTSSIISEKDYQGTPVRQQINRTEPSSPDSYSSPNNQNQKQSPHKLKHPTNMPYDPLVHTNNKPPLSFSSLIFLAIEDSMEKALPVKEIYAWIVAHYPYFKTAPTGWKNSVRHNLSLNKCFQKVEKAPNMGKGSLWRVEQQYKQNLIQALTRSSYHPCSNSLEKSPFKVSPRPAESPPGFKPGTRPLDADLFPRLSKFMAEMVSNDDTPSPPGTPIEDDYHQQIYNNNNNNNSSSNKNVILSVATGGHIVYNNERIARDWGVDSIDDVNAATAMLALKHGPKVFNESFRNGHPPIITSSPSEDHTYSAGGLGSKRSSNNNSDNNSNGTSSDAAYESSEESHNTNNMLTKEELEARHHAEGVDAFLTFATEVSSMSSPIKRPPSPDSYNGSYVEHHIPNGYYESSVIHHNNNNNNNNNHHFAYLSSPPPPKKSRSRTLRTKLKKKAWLR